MEGKEGNKEEEKQGKMRPEVRRFFPYSLVALQSSPRHEPALTDREGARRLPGRSIGPGTVASGRSYFLTETRGG
jgi:hypothetical protein